jgi:arylformamidase
MRTIDLSMPIGASTPTFPGDPETVLVRERAIDRGDAYNLSLLSFGTHTGTHIDPPSHFVPGGATLEEIDLEVLNGPCEVVRVSEGQSSVFPSDLEKVPVGTERVVFRTSNSERWAKGEGFFSDFVDLSPPAAAGLVDRGVRLVGIDSLSIESDPTVTFPVHRALLSRGVLILEGLLLGQAAPGPHRLRCLPIRIASGDGGPCRALLDPP